ncbi:MAG: iron-sulfur cluster assembly protein [Anaerolineales bacterium]|nr:iron-sulfur cluster assembly protein [Anaerolineales bacterium]
MSITDTVIRETLGTVIHPSFGLSLVALDMVRAIRIEAGQVEVDLVMNCPGCPGAEAALALARTKLKAIAGGRVVRLQLLPQLWTPPWEPGG